MTRARHPTATHDLSVSAAVRRKRLFTRTALCGALCGLGVLGAAPALALPVGGIAQVNAGGGMPTVDLSTPSATVTLNAPRTVLTWSTYNLNPGETVTYNFSSRDWIVLNRILSLLPSKIEGTIVGKVGADFGGNIWFVSQNSIIFGANSRVDAGGLLAAVGTADTASFLDPSNTLFSFSGSDDLPGAKVWALAGAAINGHGGFVGLTGPALVTRYNAKIAASGGGSVLYGAAGTYQIRLAPGTGGDFDLVDFIVPTVSAGSDAPVLADLAGETSGNSVFVAAVSKSAIGSAVINLEGLTTATRATADGGDIILSGGAGIANREAAPTLDGAFGTDIYLNTASASRDFVLQNVGHVYANPWPRPAADAIDPTTLAQDAAACAHVIPATYGGGCADGNPAALCEYFGICTGVGAALELVPIRDDELLADLFNPAAISSVTAGGDAKISATAPIQLGRVIANGDLSVNGPSVAANSLVAGGSLNVASSVGDVALAGVGVSGAGSITGAQNVMIDSISAPGTLDVSAGGGITLGDGTSDVSGVIRLTASQDVTLDLNSAHISSITAGGIANLRGGALDIGSVSAAHVLAQAASVKIDTATSGNDVYVNATDGDATVGQATAGDDVYVIATHGTASLGSATLTGAAPDAVSLSLSGVPDTAGNGRVVQVQSTDLDASLGQGVGAVTGATAVTVSAGQDAVVDVTKDLPGAFQVVAARDASLTAPTARLDAITAGRDITLDATAGDLTLTTPLTATRNISISSGGVLKVGDVTANSGSVLLSGSTVTAGAVSASQDLTLMATSGGVTTASYDVGRDLIVQGTSLSLGSGIRPVPRNLSITSLGDFTATNDLSAGGDLTLDVAGTGVFRNLSAANIRIVAGDLGLEGTVTAPTVQIESQSGAIRVGGASGSSAGQLVLDNSEFGRLHVSGQLKIYAGSTTGSARGDLTLQDLTIDPSLTPDVAFLVAPGQNALVQGAVAPAAGGGILRIGDPLDSAWRPTSIQITGSLGSATFENGVYSGIRAFDAVDLAASQDILMGSQRFISLIQATDVADIDTAAGKPPGAAPTGSEFNRIFVATGRLEVSAEGKVVQQNTSPTAGAQPVGVFFTGKSNPALVIDPPQVLDLWGAFAGSGGSVVTGPAAGGSITYVVVDSSGTPISKPAGARYSFNSCDVGTTTCAVSAASGTMTSDMNASLLTARDTLGSQLDAATSQEAAEAAVSAARLTSPPAVLSIAPVQADQVVVDPVVTGAGSEEIWRQRRQDQ